MGESAGVGLSTTSPEMEFTHSVVLEAAFLVGASAGLPVVPVPTGMTVDTVFGPQRFGPFLRALEHIIIFGVHFAPRAHAFQTM